ncbi:MAG: orotate phosphoribosyltransferase [Kiritimatiellia bacterium]|jgi:orotate phosphoribosyltransferase
MSDQTLAQRIADTCTLHGEFLLRSGATSNIYFDKYLFEANPELLRDVATQMVDLIPEGIDALAGLEMGGIPIATMLSQLTGIPALFVRKEAKAYGTCKLAEGGDIEGKKLLIIEDVVTSGGQILLSTAELRERGAIVDTVLCAIDREAGGVASLSEAGLELRPVLKRSDLE